MMRKVAKVKVIKNIVGRVSLRFYIEDKEKKLTLFALIATNSIEKKVMNAILFMCSMSRFGSITNQTTDILTSFDSSFK